MVYSFLIDSRRIKSQIDLSDILNLEYKEQEEIFQPISCNALLLLPIYCFRAFIKKSKLKILEECVKNTHKTTVMTKKKKYWPSIP